MKIRHMQAFYDLNTAHLYSYNTPIAYDGCCGVVMRDYPTNTSKKHLRAWLVDWLGYKEPARAWLFEISQDFNQSIANAIKTARKLHHEYIYIYRDNVGGYWNFKTYATRKEFYDDCTDCNIMVHCKV